MTMRLEPIETHIFTFYSFKGGVGRTMALYNCACILAGSGRRVLMIDLDLEAPGLTFFLQPHAVDGKSAPVAGEGVRKGMVELITGFVDDPKEWPLGKRDRPEAIMDYAVEVPIPEAVDAEDYEGSLHLLPAGDVDGTYAESLGRIHWDTTPLAELRDRLFRHIREVILRSELFDYVLVDARTGFSDEGYLSTRILADHIVALSGLNEQNIEGTVRFLKQVDAWNKQEEKQRRVILVKSPVPDGEYELQEKRLEAFRRKAGGDIDFSLSLPYHPRLALSERAMVDADPRSPLAQRYGELSQKVRALAEDDEGYWIRKVNEFAEGTGALSRESQSQLDYAALQTTLETLRSVNPGAFSQLAAMTIKAAFRTDPLPNSDEAVNFLRRMQECLPDEVVIPRVLARVLPHLPHDHRDEIREALSTALELERDHDNNRGESFALLELAYFERHQGNYAQALADSQKALKSFQSLGDRQGIAAALHDLAELDWSRSKFPQARKGYEEALEIKRSLGDKRGCALELQSLAEVDQLQGKHTQAREGYEEALTIRDSLGDRRAIAVTLHSLADLDQDQGDYPRAREGHEEALEIMRSLGDRRGIAGALLSLAHLDVCQNEYAQARKGYEEALEILNSLGDRQGIATTLHSLAVVDRLQGDYPQAREGYEEALEIMHSLGDLRGIAAAIHSLAQVDRLQGDYAQARKRLETAREMTHSMGIQLGFASSIHHLAELDWLEGRYARASKQYEEALGIVRTLGNRQGIAANLRALAEFDELQGDYALARERYEEALATCRSLGDQYDIAVTLHYLAGLDGLQGDYAEARRGYDEALKIKRSLGDQREVAATLHSLAGLDCLEEKYADARKEYEEALETMRSVGNKQTIAIIELYLRATEALETPGEGVEELKDAVRRAESETNPAVVVRGQLLLAKVYRVSHNTQQGLDAAAAALSSIQEHGFRGLEADANALMAVLLDEQGDRERAAEHARGAVAFFEEQGVRHRLRDELDSILG